MMGIGEMGNFSCFPHRLARDGEKRASPSLFQRFHGSFSVEGKQRRERAPVPASSPHAGRPQRTKAAL